MTSSPLPLPGYLALAWMTFSPLRQSCRVTWHLLVWRPHRYGKDAGLPGTCLYDVLTATVKLPGYLAPVCFSPVIA